MATSEAALLDAAEEIAADPDHLPLVQHLLAVLWRTALRRWHSEGMGPGGEPRVELGDLARALGLGSWHEAEAARQAWESRQLDRGRDRLAGRGWLLRRGLENVAEALYRGLTAPDQRVARAAFCLMGVVDDRGSFKRRCTTLREIREVAAAPGLTSADSALKSLMAPDPFIRVGAEAKPETERCLDVSHESLMRNWESFGDWLLRNRSDSAAMLMVAHAFNVRSERLTGLSRRSPWLLGWLKPLRGERLEHARSLLGAGHNAAWANRFGSTTSEYDGISGATRRPHAKPDFATLVSFIRGSNARAGSSTFLFAALCVVALLAGGFLITS